MKKRSNKKELIDLGLHTQEEYESCLRQLARVGKLLGGDRATEKTLASLPRQPMSILDVGCGGGYFTKRLATLYPKASVLGIDINRDAIQFANREHKLSNLRFARARPGSLREQFGSFDLVTATLVCHHLSDDELPALLHSMQDTAQMAVILNDLHRHPLAYLSYACLAPLLFRHRLITKDGLLSIKRSFQAADWERYRAIVGIPPAKWCVTWHFPFRYTVTIECSPSLSLEGASLA